MNRKKVILKTLCSIIILIQLIFGIGIAEVVAYTIEDIDSYTENEELNKLYYDGEQIEEYSEDYKKYLLLSDEEKEKIRSNTKKIRYTIRCII